MVAVKLWLSGLTTIYLEAKMVVFYRAFRSDALTGLIARTEDLFQIGSREAHWRYMLGSQDSGLDLDSHPSHSC